MAYRTFEDSGGREWHVWAVVPHLAERRADGSDRRRTSAPITFPDRRQDERRFSFIRRGLLTGTYARGWLCFDSADDKRRLSPIPGDWSTCGDERLEWYLSQAAVVRRRRPVSVLGVGSFSAPRLRRG